MKDFPTLSSSNVYFVGVMKRGQQWNLQLILPPGVCQFHGAGQGLLFAGQSRAGQPVFSQGGASIPGVNVVIESFILGTLYPIVFGPILGPQSRGAA